MPVSPIVGRQYGMFPTRLPERLKNHRRKTRHIAMANECIGVLDLFQAALGRRKQAYFGCWIDCRRDVRAIGVAWNERLSVCSNN